MSIDELESALSNEQGAPPSSEPGQRAGGGRALALPDATEAQRGLAKAAMALDGDSMRAAVRLAIREHGAITAWDDLAVPVLVGIGERWARTEAGIEIEHTASLAIAKAFDVDAPPGLSGRPVVLACAPEEQHELPMLALRAALLERQIPTSLFGKRVPAAALAAAVTRLRPRAVVLWATMPDLADPRVLQDLPNQRPPARLLAAGPGWAGASLPEGITALHSLDEAVEVLTT